ncbi:altronate dehydratase family protein [Peptoniphilus equinus]|uniref:Altronate dehydratase family protein n=1 Tax=Peptoniphilus equinus TaxID=3016343 RepID=A0ABY7QUF9_9FIRM|nr:altronate dehydratase family protein [Peptoniphilus equinus]WBW50417.1 altronate dehydratase family protein [Peptoniphilus equinus]
MKQYLKINSKDNVVVAVSDLKKDTFIKEFGFALKCDIKRGHKFAIKPIEKGQDIIKYGMSIGHATSNINEGEWVHIQNLATNLSDIIEYEYKKVNIKTDLKLVDNELKFKGYLREDGKAGVRNEIWIVPAVGCINQVCNNVKKMAENQYPNVTFKVLNHAHGCSQLGDDLSTTQSILAGLIKNPNAGGVLVISLGCENNQIEEFKKYLYPINEDRIKFVTTQDVNDEYEVCMEKIDDLVQYISCFSLTELPISKLTVAFKCGGSDGLSGLTANPLCGFTSDKLIANGATTILTEVPEMFGAENMLINRAKNEVVFKDLVTMINNFKQYFKSYGQSIYENPSPGNKDGGISTLEDKSLGCIQKGGLSEIVDVLEMGESVEESGLNLLNGPGNDQVSCTNLAASGATIIVFTTGRGNPFGSVVPTIKVSSNSELYQKKKNWIDFNAGRIIDEQITFNYLRDEFINFIIQVASGKQVNNEIYGFEEIALFKDGVIL